VGVNGGDDLLGGVYYRRVRARDFGDCGGSGVVLEEAASDFEESVVGFRVDIVKGV
jgi:hypothetical protein